MKRIIELIILIAVIASIGALTSCSSSSEADQPPNETLREQVSRERELRTSAESREANASSSADFWRTAASLLGIGLTVAFIGGAAIGTYAKKHAGS